MNGYRLAVDFGTTHTVAMLTEPDGRVRGLLFDGSPLLPSAVFVADHGRLHTGVDALRLSAVDPSAFEPSPKTRIDETTVLLGAREVAVVDLIAAVLCRVAEEAHRAAGGPIAECVLTYPAVWGAPRRGILAEGARRAGLAVTSFVPEPLAAAVCFAEVLGHRVAFGQPLAVFDFGGGTLDVAVIRRLPGGFDVVGLGGLGNLGGRDLDAAVVDLIGGVARARDPQRWQRLTVPASSDDHHDRILLWQEARQAKEMLSRAASAPVHVPGYPVSAHLTREEFERAAGPLVDRAVTTTAQVLEDARITPPELAGVFLVGGASRVPIVAQRLHRRLGIAPTVLEQPETVVAAGAAHRPAPAAPQPVPASPSPAVTAPHHAMPPPHHAMPPASTRPSMPPPAAPPKAPSRLGRRILVASIVVVVLAAATVAGVLALSGGGSGDNGGNGTEHSSGGAVDPSVLAMSLPNEVREIAKPWLGVLRSCRESAPGWFEHFSTSAAVTSRAHCALDSADAERAGVGVVSFFSFDSTSSQSTIRKGMQQVMVKIEVPAGTGYNLAGYVTPDRSSYMSPYRLKIGSASCIVYWDIEANRAAAVLGPKPSQQCQATAAAAFWRTQVSGGR